jgi:sugar fermentation stimulation protein A
MRFDPPLLRGVLARRYKRFLADVVLDGGTRVTAHVPNTGSMRSCSAAGSPVWLRHEPSYRRKLDYTLELVESSGGLVAVHTGRTNDLVQEALERESIPELVGYPAMRREATWGSSRFDFRLSSAGGECLVEVKSVTHVEGEAALFPDAVTKRGLKHLRELGGAAAEGFRCVLLFVVQRPDGRFVAPAERIDPDYAQGLREAAAGGVELLAYRAVASPRGMELTGGLPVRLHAGRDAASSTNAGDST